MHKLCKINEKMAFKLSFFVFLNIEKYQTKIYNNVE